MVRTTVYLVEDHPAVSKALTSTLESTTGMKVCGASGTFAEAFGQIELREPDVAIVDISLEDGDGLVLTENLKVKRPEVEVVVFSMYNEREYAERALRAGASGYVMKSEPTSSVVEAIEAVERGEVYLSCRMSCHLLNKAARKDATEPGTATNLLSDQEMRVFQMIGEGYTVEEIQERLSLTRKTVEARRRQAKEKMGFETVSGLLRYAVQWQYRQGILAGRDQVPPPPTAALEEPSQ
jgi:DNA-binding NarL/FixJ family response regulator